ncbi:MAG: hypothetical protein AB1324_05070 [Candidatus Micrarchaeota archaeon]
MAQATRTPEPAQQVDAERLLSVVRALPRAMSVTHPTNAPNVTSAAQNALYIGQILEIVRGGRPAEGDARRQVYDEAVRLLAEGGGQNGAAAYLTRSHVASIRRLHELVRQGESVGEQQRAPTETMLARIDRGIGQGEEAYLEYEAIGSEVTALLRVLRGGRAQEAPRAQDTATGRQQLPLIEMPLRDFGPVHLLHTSSEESVVTLNAQVTPTTSSLFGGQANAQTAMNALANAYATMANHPNDLGAQQAAASSLHSALRGIPSEREIWNASVHPHFAAAMQALANGDLQTGLRELSQETAFNSVYGALNNLYIISVNQRAISVLRGGVTVRYEFERNMEAFTEFIRGSRSGNFEPRILWMGIGLFYERLLVSGELQQLQVNPAGTGADAVRTVGRQRVTGTGDVFSVTPQLALGASAWGEPMQIVFHCNVIPYQRYEIGGDVQTTEGPRRVTTGYEGFGGIGIWGVEVQLPGREGQRGRVRVPRFGVADVGLTNPTVYATIQFNWLESNNLRIVSEVTPTYSYFLEQHRVGAELRPADFTHQLGQGWTLFYGPGFRYEVVPGGEGRDTRHYLEGYGTFGFRFDRGVAVDLRGGYLGELGGREVDRLPGSPYGSLNLTITPQLWGEQRRTPRVTGDSVPQRRRRRSQE